MKVECGVNAMTSKAIARMDFCQDLVQVRCTIRAISSGSPATYRDKGFSQALDPMLGGNTYLVLTPSTVHGSNFCRNISENSTRGTTDLTTPPSFLSKDVY